MPTGYTEIIENGGTFEEYALRCARAMGVCVTMRDDPLDVPIPEIFEPSDWYNKRIQEIEEKISELKTMSINIAAHKARQEWEKKLQERNQCMKEEKEKASKYAHILKKVKDWQPPTSDHQNLKDFMLDQINLCTSGKYIPSIPVLKTGTEWLSEKMAKAQQDLDYYIKENEDEIERCKARTVYMQQLKKSLK